MKITITKSKWNQLKLADLDYDKTDDRNDQDELTDTIDERAGEKIEEIIEILEQNDVSALLIDKIAKYLKEKYIETGSEIGFIEWLKLNGKEMLKQNEDFIEQATDYSNYAKEVEDTENWLKKNIGKY